MSAGSVTAVGEPEWCLGHGFEPEEPGGADAAGRLGRREDAGDDGDGESGQ